MAHLVFDRMWRKCIVAATAALALRRTPDAPDDFDFDPADDSDSNPPSLVSTESSDYGLVGAGGYMFNADNSSESDSSEDELPTDFAELAQHVEVFSQVPLPTSTTHMLQPMDSFAHAAIFRGHLAAAQLISPLCPLVAATRARPMSLDQVTVAERRRLIGAFVGGRRTAVQQRQLIAAVVGSQPTSSSSSSSSGDQPSRT